MILMSDDGSDDSLDDSSDDSSDEKFSYLWLKYLGAGHQVYARN